MRAEDLVILEQACGGWAKGRRKWHLIKYAEFLRGAGQEVKGVLTAVKVMAGNCKPAYPSDPNDTPLRSIVTEVFSKPLPKYTTETLSGWLGITAEKARVLELQTIVPDEVARERRPAPGGEREAKRQERRDWMRERIVRGGKISCRGLLKELTDAGFKTNRQTVNDDLNALGLKVTRKSAGRPAANQLTLLEN